MEHLIRKILLKNGINEPFTKLATKGIANEIYATANYVIRIPTDHPEACSDALTESVAAPLAWRNGIKTPKLVVFDDTYTVLRDKTFSIWERVHGLTLGEVDHYLHYRNTWREIGSELGKLHLSINECHDPKNWLDHPDRDYTKEKMVQALLGCEIKPSYLLELIEENYTHKTFTYQKRFVHGDTNQYNFLCTESDSLLSIIDWGDAGWADPAIDFYMIPFDVIDVVLGGYHETAGSILDDSFIHRLLLDKVWIGIEEKQDLNVLENSIIRLRRQILEHEHVDGNLRSR